MRFYDYGYGSTYGMRFHPIKKKYLMHNGIDFKLTLNTPIESNVTGQVITSTYGSGFGNYVVVKDASGYQHLYAHMSQRSVNVGDFVVQGQTLGLTGSTGLSTGPHLHYEVKDPSGKNIDPMPYAQMPYNSSPTQNALLNGFQLGLGGTEYTNTGFNIGESLSNGVSSILRIVTIILLFFLFIFCLTQAIDINIL